ncbi:MAG: BLUF domain-containing protein [Gammaproteobacteria bacterium]|nr:BLUF domain-containing protein [Gammaproteobacteria bacterium]
MNCFTRVVVHVIGANTHYLICWLVREIGIKAVVLRVYWFVSNKVQLLEGEEKHVLEVYRPIYTDARHSEATTVCEEGVWSAVCRLDNGLSAKR